MHWDSWDDNEGRCYTAKGYVVREVSTGQWFLDGHGLCERGRDPELLKMTAEDHERQYQRLAVGAGAPLPEAPESVDTHEYLGELRELQLASKRLRRITGSVNPLEHREIAGSRAALEAVRDRLQLIIESLP